MVRALNSFGLQTWFMKLILLLPIFAVISYTAIAQSGDSIAGYKMRYYTQAGLQWSGHPGIDAALHVVIGDNLCIGSRLWFSDYASKNFPKIKESNSSNIYPYSHEEIAILGGWYHELSKGKWFCTIETGPSYVRYFYPIKIEDYTDTKGVLHTAYQKKMITAAGAVLTGSFNWHYQFVALGISPQYFVNHVHAYGALTVSAYFYLP